MPTFTIYLSQNLSCATGCAAVVGGITRETWSRDKGDIAGIRVGPPIPVCVTSMDCCFGPPKIIVIFVEECCDEAVIHPHVHHGQGPSIFGKRMPALLCNLLDDLIEDLSRRGRRIEDRDV